MRNSGVVAQAGCDTQLPTASETPNAARHGMIGGLLGGVCCLGGAVAAGLGVGGVSFFGSLMDRYQGYFLAASLVLMALYGVRTVRQASGNQRLAGAVRVMRRPLQVMGGMYVLTLLFALAASSLAGLS